MKFYVCNKNNFKFNIYFAKNNKLSAILHSEYYINFFKNGYYHNNNNFSSIVSGRFKSFYFNGMFYGNEHVFTKKKKTWRKFARKLKLQAFL